MNIPDKIYANLAPIERMRAAVLASARDDKEELQILKETCPKRTFLMTDPEYSEGMMKLFSLLLFIEYQLTTYALDFQASRLSEREERFNAQECALMATASVVAALNQLIAEMGLIPKPWPKMPLRAIRHCDDHRVRRRGRSGACGIQPATHAGTTRLLLSR